MDKCKDCIKRGEQWVGENLDILFTYCGIIESIIEDAIDIDNITICPIDMLKINYRDKIKTDLESKSIPMKPYVGDECGNYVDVCCENCDHTLQRKYIGDKEIKESHCPSCEQAIDWSE